MHAALSPNGPRKTARVSPPVSTRIKPWSTANFRLAGLAGGQGKGWLTLVNQPLTKPLTPTPNPLGLNHIPKMSTVDRPPCSPHHPPVSRRICRTWSAVRYPVAGSPSSACHSAMARRVPGPKVPSVRSG